MRCTCAGTAPGYPQHEEFCGQDDGDPVAHGDLANGRPDLRDLAGDVAARPEG